MEDYIPIKLLGMFPNSYLHLCKVTGNLGYYKNAMQRKIFALSQKRNKIFDIFYEKRPSKCAQIFLCLIFYKYIHPTLNAQIGTAGFNTWSKNAECLEKQV